MKFYLFVVCLFWLIVACQEPTKPVPVVVAETTKTDTLPPKPPYSFVKVGQGRALAFALAKSREDTRPSAVKSLGKLNGLWANGHSAVMLYPMEGKWQMMYFLKDGFSTIELDSVKQFLE